MSARAVSLGALGSARSRSSRRRSSAPRRVCSTRSSTPPAIVRAALVGGSVAIGVVLLSRSLARMSEGTSDVPALIRGVRLAFLAVAAFAAAAGWGLGHPLPLLVALVIAGIDVVETSFLLVVVGPDRG